MNKYQSVHFKVISATKRYYAETAKVSKVSLNLTLGTHISMDVHSLKLDKLKAMCENSRFRWVNTYVQGENNSTLGSLQLFVYYPLMATSSYQMTISKNFAKYMKWKFRLYFCHILVFHMLGYVIKLDILIRKRIVIPSGRDS